MQVYNFEVDFNGVTDKQGTIRKLVLVFHLPDVDNWNWNWDAFEDYFTNLDPDSEVVRNSDPKPKEVHLVVKNIETVKKISEKDYNVLLSILQDATKKENRGDDIKFSYEII